MVDRGVRRFLQEDRLGRVTQLLEGLAGDRSPARSLSSAELLDEYLAELGNRNVSPATIAAYQFRLRIWFEWLFMSELEVDQVTRANLQKYLTDLRTLETEASRKFSAKYVNCLLGAVRTFFAWCVDEKEYLLRNPAARIAPLKLPRRLPRILEESDARKVMEAAAEPRERVICELLYGSGVRAAELLAIDLEDLKLESGDVLIRGKGGDEALQPVSSRAVEALRAWLPVRARMLQERAAAHARAAKLRAGGMTFRAIAREMAVSVPIAFKYAGTDPWPREERALLIGRQGRLKKSHLRNIVAEIAARAEIDQRVYPHLLRHCYATHLLNGGADLRVVQELMRHKKLATTEIYTHVSRKRLKAEFEKAHPRARLQTSANGGDE